MLTSLLYISFSFHLYCTYATKQCRCTLEGALAKTDQNPCAGGVVVDPKKEDKTGDGCPTESFEDRIASAQLIEVVPAAGERPLPAFDCSCLTGFHCCLLIKASVRDADIYNKAIQCHLNYVPESDKHNLFRDGRGKVVNIYQNHNFVVNKVPYVEGSWPAPYEPWSGPGSGYNIP